MTGEDKEFIRVQSVITTKFGQAGVTPQGQTSGPNQVAPAAYATGAFGLDSDVKMEALYELILEIRTTLVANGIMKGAA